MRLTTLVMACLLVATPAMAQDKATIEKLNDAFIAAFSKGDFADATVLPNGSTMVKGRPGIQAFWAQARQEVAGIKLTIVDVMPLGPEAARAIGTFLLTTKDQQSHQVVGKYVVVWQKVGATGSSQRTSGTPTSSAGRDQRDVSNIYK
jgi:ketosteroid isomerase-like protein